MFQFIKIALLVLLLFIISCDEENLDSTNSNKILGCTDNSACNYDSNATEDDGNCEMNLFCYDSDGDGLGYGDSTQICLDEIPSGWVVDCNDPEEDCAGMKDDCGECNGNNQSKDCNGVCFGPSMSDTHWNCCELEKMQNLQPLSFEFCILDTFKWSLKMTATLGDYIDNIFIPSSDSVSTDFIIGTHYLSTDSLDILEDMNYNDIVQPPSTVENSIYFYTSHPEWEYEFGNNFMREYKLHSMDSIMWNGYMTSDLYGEKHIKFSFELDSEIDVWSQINFNFNNETNIAAIDSSLIWWDCESDLSFHNLYWNNLGCNITNPDFEYIIPVTFQGPSYLMPFSIEISNLVVF